VSGYQPKKLKPTYRAVAITKGNLVVEKHGPWWRLLFFGTRWYPISNLLSDEFDCDEVVARDRLEESKQKTDTCIFKIYH
jgi:hypothetical protein